MLTKEDYQEALTIQDSSSLSAVVHSFNETISRVWDEAREKGEDAEWVNSHPICRLFAGRIAELAKITIYDDEYPAHGGDDYAYCERKANGEADPTNDCF